MVVPASDFPGAVPTAPASHAGVGPTDAAGIPTVPGQSVPPVDAGAAAGAAPPTVSAPIDVATIQPEIASYLESHYRTGYIPEANLRELQSSLDSQIASERSRAELASSQVEGYRAQLSAAQRAFNSYVADLMAGTRQPHANDAASFILAIQQAGGQVVAEGTSAQAQLRQWESQHQTGLQAKIDTEALGGDGLPAIPREVIANDPEIQRLDRELREAARLDARERYQNPQHRQTVYATTQALQDRIGRVAQLERLKLAGGQLSGEAALVQSNLERQSVRGVQTAAVLGAGALSGAYDEDAAWASTRAQVAAKYGIDPNVAEANHWDEIYQAWVPGFDAANTALPRR